MALGIRPVGAADTTSWRTWVRTPTLPIGIVDVGTRAEPNIERIAELKPDLILIGPTQVDLIDVLERIAPVLCFENHRAGNRLGQAETAMTHLKTLARLLGREDAAQTVIEEINKTLASCANQLRSAFGKLPPVQVIRFSSLTTLFVYTPNSIADYVLKRMGIEQPFVRPNAEYGLTQVRIRDLKALDDAYVIYIRPFAQENAVRRSILWQATPFARKGHVAAAQPYWSHGGALSIMTTAESITQALLTLAPKTQEATSSGPISNPKVFNDITPTAAQKESAR